MGDVKRHVKAQWGVPVVEQRLVLLGRVAPDGELLTEAGGAENEMDFMLVRGPAFHFDKKLAHPRIKLSTDRAMITHGGQSEYQAAFLSDILDREGMYRVRFKLEDSAGNEFKEMYVGVAPDHDRNWTNLKGAYLNR